MEFVSKTDKNTRVLMLYHSLLNGEHIDKQTFILSHSINERTFDRDIESLRLFLSEMYSPDELLYDRDTKTYYLSGHKAEYMDRTEATILMKVLLNSKVFRTDEMEGLVQSILSVVKRNDKTALMHMFQDEKTSYQSDMNVPIVKLIADLYYSIDKGFKIEIQTTNIDNLDKSEHVKMMPKRIILRDSRFYLIGRELSEPKREIEIPVSTITCFMKV